MLMMVSIHYGLVVVTLGWISDYDEGLKEFLDLNRDSYDCNIWFGFDDSGFNSLHSIYVSSV